LRYVSRLFVEYLILVWVGFTALLQIFDLLSNSDEIQQRFPGSFTHIATYALWRIPSIASFLLPFAVLLALLLTLSRLERNSEILAYKAAGAPYSFVLLALMPAVSAVAILHFFMADRFVPYSVAHLEKAGLNLAIDQAADNTALPVWRRDGNTVIRVGTVWLEGILLAHPNLYFRAPDGTLEQVLFANRAAYEPRNKVWHFYDVHGIDLRASADQRQSWQADYYWQSSLVPNDFAGLSEKPESLTFKQIASYALGDRTGPRPAYFYTTWLFRRFLLPISTLLMVLLAAPVAQALQRRDRSLTLGMTAGFLLGFLYFIADGMSLSLGESGALPPFLAASLPILLFASLGGLALIRAEGY
jgi:lipopolysaccharide export system permease protein